MRVIIAGSRHITDRERVFGAIARSGFDIGEIVCGGAAGVDDLGDCYAHEWDIPVEYFVVTRDGVLPKKDFDRLRNLRLRDVPVRPDFSVETDASFPLRVWENVRAVSDWTRDGKPAGPIRNNCMACYGDALILIWTGDREASPGSYSMRTLAKKYGLKVYEEVVE